MCGIVGVAGNLEYKDESLTRRLLLFDYYRGMDATGLAAIRQSGEIHTAKINSHPFDLFDMSRFKTALAGNQSKAFIGHNRAATRGANTSANAHPFVSGDIVGVHNGTLDFSSLRDLEKELGEMFQVDSQALITAIDKFGLKDAMSLCSGSWSLVYYDRSNNTLNMLRNKERPMNYAYSEDMKKLFFASQWEIIQAAIQTQGGYKLYSMKFEEGTKDEYDSEYFKTNEDFHYQWDLAALREGKAKPHMTKIEGKPPPPPTNQYHPATAEEWEQVFHRTPMGGPPSGTDGNGTTRDNAGNVILLPNGRTTTNGSTTTSSSGRNFVNRIGDKTKPFAGFLTEEEHQDMTRRGCAWCQGPVEYDDLGQIVIERLDAIVGPCCSGESKVNRVFTKVDYYLN